MKKCTLFRIIPALLALISAGCATLTDDAAPDASPEGQAQVAPAADAAPRWYYLRFQFRRNSQNEVERHLDLLVAHQIIAPVLARYRDDIDLWRFHRRWPDDAAGHQFSFIVRTPPEKLALIDRDIRQNTMLARLREDGHLRRYRVDADGSDSPGALAATSDRAWPDELQREWPHFIMGSSRMWLGLVAAAAAKREAIDPYTRYAKASDALDDLWFNTGNHALFHHLSALFGYQPLRIIRRDIMTF